MLCAKHPTASSKHQRYFRKPVQAMSSSLIDSGAKVW